MLKTAAVLNFLLAAGHVLCLFRLDAAFRLYRIEPFMDRLAALWPPIPYLITLGVADLARARSQEAVASAKLAQRRADIQQLQRTLEGNAGGTPR